MLPLHRYCVAVSRFRISFLFLLQSMVSRSALLNQCFACPFCNSHQVGSPHQSYRDAAVSIGGPLGIVGKCNSWPIWMCKPIEGTFDRRANAKPRHAAK